MRQKLFDLLGSFSRQEMRDFEKFLRSPFHKPGRDLIPFFSSIKDYHPDFKFDKAAIYRKLYPKGKYNDARFRRLSSFLYKMVEEFLVQTAVRGKNIEKEFYLLEQLSQRHLHRQFEINLRKLKSYLTASAFPLEKYFLAKLDLYNYEGTHAELKGDLDTHNRCMVDYTESSICFLLTRFIRNYIIRINQEKSYRQKIQSGLIEAFSGGLDLDKVFRAFQTEGKSENKIMLLLYKIYLAFRHTDEPEYFQDAKKHLIECLPALHKGEKYFLLNDLTAWCILKQQSGSQEYVREEFELTKLKVEHNAYTASDSEPLSLVNYRNGLILGLDLREFKWVENYINTFIGKVDPTHQDNMRFYSNAYLQYYKGNYERCLENLSRVKYEHFIFKRDVRIIMLKVYYELKLYDEAYSLLDAVRHYLRTSKEVTKDYRTWDYNFVRFYERILKLSDNPDPDSIELTREEIKNENYVESKNWLLRKLSELSVHPFPVTSSND